MEAELNLSIRAIEHGAASRYSANDGSLVTTYEADDSDPACRAVKAKLDSLRVTHEAAWASAAISAAERLTSCGQYHLAATCCREVLVGLLPAGTACDESIRKVYANLAVEQLEIGTRALLCFAESCSAAAFAADPQLLSATTVQHCQRCVGIVQLVIQILNHETQQKRNQHLYYLLYNATVVLLAIVEPVVTASPRVAWVCLPILTFAIVSIEATPLMAAPGFISWRVQLYGTAGRIYDRLGLQALPEMVEPPSTPAAVAGSKGAPPVATTPQVPTLQPDVLADVVGGARAMLDRSLRILAALRRLYLADPPVLEETMASLDAARLEMSLRKLRFDSFVGAGPMLSQMARLLPQANLQVAALVHAVSWGHTSVRRVLFHSPPGSEAIMLGEALVSIVGGGSTQLSAVKSEAATVNECKRVDALLAALYELLRPFQDACVPVITAYVAFAMETFTHTAAVKPGDPLQQGRSRSSLSSGVFRKSAMKRATSDAGMGSGADTPSVAPFPLVAAELEAGAAATLLSISLHVQLLHILHSYEQWGAFSFFLHAAEARLLRFRLEGGLPEPEWLSLSFDCLLLRRMRELEVGTIPAPLKPLWVELEAARATTPTHAKDGKGGASGKDAKGGKAPIKESARDTTAAKGVKAGDKQGPASSSPVAQPSLAAPELPTKPNSISALALVTTPTMAAEPPLPVVCVTAVQLQACCDVVCMCTRMSRRGVKGLHMPGLATVTPVVVEGLSPTHVSSKSDLISDSISILWEYARALRAWKDGRVVTPEASAVDVRVDDCLWMLYRTLFGSCAALPVHDVMLAGEVALRYCQCCLERGDPRSAIQAAQSALRTLQCERDRLLSLNLRGGVEPADTTGQRHTFRHWGPMDMHSLQQDCSTATRAPEDGADRSARPATISWTHQSTLAALQSDLLATLFSAECRQSARETYVRAIHSARVGRHMQHEKRMESTRRRERRASRVSGVAGAQEGGRAVAGDTVASGMFAAAATRSRSAFNVEPESAARAAPSARKRALLAMLGLGAEEDEIDEVHAEALAALGPSFEGFSPSKADETRMYAGCKCNASWKALAHLAVLPYRYSRESKQRELSVVESLLLQAARQEAEFAALLSSPQAPSLDTTEQKVSGDGIASGATSGSPSKTQRHSELLSLAQSKQVPDVIRRSLLVVAHAHAGGAGTRKNDGTEGERVLLPPPQVLCRTSSSVTLALPETQPIPAGCHIRMFGKVYGAGTAVAVTNCDLRGTGVAIHCVNTEGSSLTNGTLGVEMAPACCRKPVCIDRLVPNEQYNFAYGVYSAAGELVGGALSASTPAVLVTTPLPVLLTWGYVSMEAAKCGLPQVAMRAALHVIKQYVSMGPMRPQLTGLPLASACYALRRDVLEATPRPVLQVLTRCLCLVGELSKEGILTLEEACSRSPALAPGSNTSDVDGWTWTREGALEGPGCASEQELLLTLPTSKRSQLGAIRRAACFGLACELATALRDPYLMQMAACAGIAALTPLLHAAGHQYPVSLGPLLMQLHFTLRMLPEEALHILARKAQDRASLYLFLCATVHVSTGSPSAFDAVWYRYTFGLKDEVARVQKSMAAQPAGPELNFRCFSGAFRPLRDYSAWSLETVGSGVGFQAPARLATALGWLPSASSGLAAGEELEYVVGGGTNDRFFTSSAAFLLSPRFHSLVAPLAGLLASGPATAVPQVGEKGKAGTTASSSVPDVASSLPMTQLLKLVAYAAEAQPGSAAGAVSAALLEVAALAQSSGLSGVLETLLKRFLFVPLPGDATSDTGAGSGGRATGGAKGKDAPKAAAKAAPGTALGATGSSLGGTPLPPMVRVNENFPILLRAGLYLALNVATPNTAFGLDGTYAALQRLADAAPEGVVPSSASRPASPGGGGCGTGAVLSAMWDSSRRVDLRRLLPYALAEPCTDVLGDSGRTSELMLSLEWCDVKSAVVLSLLRPAAVAAVTDLGDIPPPVLHVDGSESKAEDALADSALALQARVVEALQHNGLVFKALVMSTIETDDVHGDGEDYGDFEAGVEARVPEGFTAFAGSSVVPPDTSRSAVRSTSALTLAARDKSMRPAWSWLYESAFLPLKTRSKLLVLARYDLDRTRCWLARLLACQPGPQSDESGTGAGAGTETGSVSVSEGASPSSPLPPPIMEASIEARASNAGEPVVFVLGGCTAPLTPDARELQARALMRITPPPPLTLTPHTLTNPLPLLRITLSAASDAAMLGRTARAWGVVFAAIQAGWTALAHADPGASVFGAAGSNSDSSSGTDDAQATHQSVSELGGESWGTIPEPRVKRLPIVTATLDWRPLWRLAVCALEIIQHARDSERVEAWPAADQHPRPTTGKTGGGGGSAGGDGRDAPRTPSNRTPGATATPTAGGGLGGDGRGKLDGTDAEVAGSPSRLATRPRSASGAPTPGGGGDSPRSMAGSQHMLNASGSSDFGSSLGGGSEGEPEVSDGEEEEEVEDLDGGEGTSARALPPGFSKDAIVWMCKLVGYTCHALLCAQQFQVLTSFCQRTIALRPAIVELLGGVNAFSQSPNPFTPNAGWSGLGGGDAVALATPDSSANMGPNWLRQFNQSLTGGARTFGACAAEDALACGLYAGLHAAKLRWSLAHGDTVESQSVLSRLMQSFAVRPSLTARVPHRRASILEQMAAFDAEERSFEHVKSVVQSRVERYASIETMRLRTLRVIQRTLSLRMRDMASGRKALTLAREKVLGYAMVTQKPAIAPALRAVLAAPVEEAPAGGAGVSIIRALRSQASDGHMVVPSVGYQDTVVSLENACQSFRSRREVGLLVQALNCQGWVHTAQYLRVKAAREASRQPMNESASHLLTAAINAWKDGLDACFSILDVADNWVAAVAPGQDMASSLSLLQSHGLVGCIFPVLLAAQITAASRSQVGAAGEGPHLPAGQLVGDQPRNLLLLAAFCVKATFGEDSSHPLANIGFSRQRPSHWNLGVDPFSDTRLVSVPQLVSALKWVAGGLLEYGTAFADRALPVCALLEYLAVFRLGDVRLTLEARLLRCRAQLILCDFEGAVETLAHILRGSDLPAQYVVIPQEADSTAVSGSQGGGKDAPDIKDAAGKGSKVSKTAATPSAASAAAAAAAAGGGGKKGAAESANALHKDERRKALDLGFTPRPSSSYPPFYNSLPPHHPANKEALAWLSAPMEDVRVQPPAYMLKCGTTGQVTRAHLLRAELCRRIAETLPTPHDYQRTWQSFPPDVSGQTLYHAAWNSVLRTMSVPAAGFPARNEASFSAHLTPEFALFVPSEFEGGEAVTPAPTSAAKTGAKDVVAAVSEGTTSPSSRAECDTTWKDSLLSVARSIVFALLTGELKGGPALPDSIERALLAGVPDSGSGAALSAPASGKPSDKVSARPPSARSSAATTSPTSTVTTSPVTALPEGKTGVVTASFRLDQLQAKVAVCEELAHVLMQYQDFRGALSVAAVAQQCLLNAMGSLPAHTNSSVLTSMPTEYHSHVTWAKWRYLQALCSLRLGNPKAAVEFISLGRSETTDAVCCRRLLLLSALAYLTDGKHDAAAECLVDLMHSCTEAREPDAATTNDAQAFVAGAWYDATALADSSTVADACALAVTLLDSDFSSSTSKQELVAGFSSFLQGTKGTVTSTPQEALLELSAALTRQRVCAIAVDVGYWHDLAAAVVPSPRSAPSLPLAAPRLGLDTLYNPAVGPYVSAQLGLAERRAAGVASNPDATLIHVETSTRAACTALTYSAFQTVCTTPLTLARIALVVGRLWLRASQLVEPTSLEQAWYAFGAEAHLRVCAALTTPHGPRAAALSASATQSLLALACCDVVSSPVSAAVTAAGSVHPPIGRAAVLHRLLLEASAFASQHRVVELGYGGFVPASLTVSEDATSATTSGSKSKSGTAKDKDTGPATALQPDAYLARLAAYLPLGTVAQIKALRQSEAMSAGSILASARAPGARVLPEPTDAQLLQLAIRLLNSPRLPPSDWYAAAGGGAVADVSGEEDAVAHYVEATYPALLASIHPVESVLGVLATTATAPTVKPLVPAGALMNFPMEDQVTAMRVVCASVIPTPSSQVLLAVFVGNVTGSASGGTASSSTQPIAGKAAVSAATKPAAKPPAAGKVASPEPISAAASTGSPATEGMDARAREPKALFLPLALPAYNSLGSINIAATACWRQLKTVTDVAFLAASSIVQEGEAKLSTQAESGPTSKAGAEKKDNKGDKAAVAGVGTGLASPVTGVVVELTRSLEAECKTLLRRYVTWLVTCITGQASGERSADIDALTGLLLEYDPAAASASSTSLVAGGASDKKADKGTSKALAPGSVGGSTTSGDVSAIVAVKDYDEHKWDSSEPTSRSSLRCLAALEAMLRVFHHSEAVKHAGLATLLQTLCHKDKAVRLG